MNIIVLDTETTGLADNARIVQIGLLVWDSKGNLTGDRVIGICNPEVKMTSDVIRVHGITNETAAKAPLFREYADKIISILSMPDSILVGHNVGYDIARLRYELSLLGLTIPSLPVVDTLRLCRNLLRLRSNRLGVVVQELNLSSNKNWHQAVADVQMTKRLFDYFVERFITSCGKSLTVRELNYIQLKHGRFC